MSSIFGIYNRSGQQVSDKLIDKMADAISYWRPDDTGKWTNGSLALGHAMLWNTPESKYEHLPLLKDAYVLTMDARIDNRNELVNKIELPNRSLLEIGDSEFILGAYKRWGERCPEYLLGDFSFAIWDEQKKQLFCARDHAGIKQFYYHLSDDLFLFGNNLKGLTQYLGIAAKIDDEAVANYIVNNILLDKRKTFFEAFKKLPPAHTLTITPSTIKVNCYWRLEDAPKGKLPNAEAYIKKLRELLEEAVYARMRSDYSITSHLSGGLDSSGIAVIAARKLKERSEKLLAFNWLHEPEAEDDPEHYEWANSKKIAEREGIAHHYVPLTSKDICKYMDEYDLLYGETAVFWHEYPVRYAARKKGSRTILSGWGGDELVTYHGQSFYADLFMQGKFLKLFKALNTAMKKKESIKSKLSRIYHRLLIPLVPESLYCKMPKITCDKAVFPFVKKEFLPMVVKESEKPRVLTMQAKKTIRKHMLAYWQNGHLQGRIESWGVSATAQKIEYSYPLLDKRMIEFIVGVPAKYFVENGVGRYLFRMAIQDLLPEEIIWGKTKREPNRVQRLLGLVLASFRLKLKEEKLRHQPSDYVDINKILEFLQEMELSSQEEKIKLIVQMKTSVLLMAKI